MIRKEILSPPLSVQDPCLVVEVGAADLVVVFGAGVFRLGLGLVQLGLAELDNRAQAQLVSSLGEVEGLGGFVEKLGGQAETLVGRVGIQPSQSHVARHPVGLIAKVLVRCLSSQSRFGGARRIEASIKDGDVDVQTGGRVAVGQL